MKGICSPAWKRLKPAETNDVGHPSHPVISLLQICFYSFIFLLEGYENNLSQNTDFYYGVMDSLLFCFCFVFFLHVSVVGMYLLYVFPLVLLYLSCLGLRWGYYQLDHLTACFNSFWSVWSVSLLYDYHTSQWPRSSWGWNSHLPPFCCQPASSSSRVLLWSS